MAQSSLTVRIAKNYSDSLMRQTPGYSGRWGKFQFTERDENADILVVLNSNAELRGSYQSQVLILQEPPPGQPASWFSERTYDGVFAPVALDGIERLHLAHGALPWHVQKDFGFLANCAVPTKNKYVSWITSNKTWWPGHCDRMNFLDQLQRYGLPFDLFGFGFNAVADKWDALAPYRYSLAIENFRGGHYWTEKLADCFLAWTMPIYCGSPHVLDYFPSDALILIDIDHPREAIEIIDDAVASRRFEKSTDAVAHARELVLRRYQLFPFVAERLALNSLPEQGQGPPVCLLCD